MTVLDPHVSTRGEMGHLVMTVLGMVAQMERRFIKVRIPIQAGHSFRDEAGRRTDLMSDGVPR